MVIDLQPDVCTNSWHALWLMSPYRTGSRLNTKFSLFWIQHLSMLMVILKNINTPESNMPSLNYESKVLCDTVMSAGTLSHDTFSLKFTLAISLIDNLVRMCHPICHKFQHTKPIVSVNKGCHEPTFWKFTVVVECVILSGVKLKLVRKEMASYLQNFHQSGLNALIINIQMDLNG